MVILVNLVLCFGYVVYFGKVVSRVGALLLDGVAYCYLFCSVVYMFEFDVMMVSFEVVGFFGV